MEHLIGEDDGSAARTGVSLVSPTAHQRRALLVEDGENPRILARAMLEGTKKFDAVGGRTTKPWPDRRPKRDKGFLELETRRAIYEHVERVPGVHLRQIQRDLDMPLGTLEYHLHQMEKRDLLVTRQLSRFKAYFAAGGLDRRDRDSLYFLRQDMPRRLTLLIVDRPGVSFAALRDSVPIASSTVSFHLKKLLGAGLIEEGKDGREKVYYPVERERIQRLVVVYRKSFVDDVVDRFARAWLDIGI